MNIEQRDDNICEEDSEGFQFSAEASALGFAPGRWPKTFPTQLGDATPFEFLEFDDDGSAIYRQQGSGELLIIFND
jgi:hypothetical protein